VNTTVICAYSSPKVRLPGSGGPAEIAAHADKIYILTKLNRRTFVSQLDFVTSPGFITGSDDRSGLHLPGGGPRLVITDKALFSFTPTSREMVLTALYPGVDLQDVHDSVGWELPTTEDVDTAEPPTPDELNILRQVLDINQSS
jgi:glutaconate CoA-transferase subunit B